MKLNPDCIRDIMLYLEENLTLQNSISTRLLTKELPAGYTYEEVLHSVNLLCDEKYIIASSVHGGRRDKNFSFDITDITWKGHEFLESVRDSKIWNTVKNELQKAGVSTMHLLGQVCLAVTTKIATSPGMLDKIMTRITEFFS